MKHSQRTLCVNEAFTKFRESHVAATSVSDVTMWQLPLYLLFENLAPHPSALSRHISTGKSHLAAEMRECKISAKVDILAPDKAAHPVQTRPHHIQSFVSVSSAVPRRIFAMPRDDAVHWCSMPVCSKDTHQDSQANVQCGDSSVWNSLSNNICNVNSLSAFCNKLKTLFTVAYMTWVIPNTAPFYLGWHWQYGSLQIGFYARQHIYYSAYMPCQLRLSVHPSVTWVLCVKTAEILSLSDRPIILVFRHQGSLRKSDSFSLNGAPNTRGSNFRPICGYVSETIIDRGIVTMEDNSRSQYSLKTNISQTVHPILSMFGSRLGFSGLADQMALFPDR